MRKLLQTLSAVGLLVCSGQLDAFGTGCTLIEEDDARKQQLHWSAPQLQPTDILRQDALQLVLAHSSLGTHPVDLQLVCISWRNALRENTPIQLDLKFAGLNPGMQTCMNAWWKEKFKKAIIRHTDLKDAKKVINLNFCDALNGTLDISQFGDTSKCLRMTLSIDEFLRVKGDNEDKVVILFATHQMIKSLIDTSAKPFVKILEGWDPSFPFGIFWKWGNHEEFYVDYLINSGAKQISSRNIFENWKKSVRSAACCVGQVGMGGFGRYFHVYFCEPKLGL